MPVVQMPRLRCAVVATTTAAALAAAAACHAVADPEPNGAPTLVRAAEPVQTDALVYALRRTAGAYEATAVATYVNRTGAPVYYARCGVGDYGGPIFWSRRTGPDSARTLFTSFAWACVGGVPTGAIAPGDSVTARVPLGALDQPHMTPPPRPEDIVGRMRVEFELCARYRADSDTCEPLPQAERQSNAFDIRY